MRTNYLIIASLALAVALGACREDDEDITGDSGSAADQGVTEGGTQDGGGGTATETTIYKITKGEVKEGAKVILKTVVVSAVDGFGKYKGDVYVQEKAGGKNSAIKLFNPTRRDGKKVNELKVGDEVKVEGTVKYWAPKTGFTDKKCTKKTHIKELDKASLTFIKSGTAPTPVVVTVKDLQDCTIAEEYEHVLVTWNKVAVTKLEKKTDYTAVKVTGNGELGDDIAATDKLTVGGCYNFTGVVVYFYAYRLHPRSAADMTTATGCPTAKPFTIKQIQDAKDPLHPKEGALVKVKGVVTAVDQITNSNSQYGGFWIQDETATGPFNGIYVFYSWTAKSDAAKIPQLDDKVEVSATYKEYYSLSELTDATFTKNGKVTTSIAPIKVKADDVKTKATTAEGYEGMLVELSGITVGATVKTKSGTPIGFKDETSGLIVENAVVDFMKPTAPVAKTVYKSIVGVMGYNFNERRLYPRSLAEMKK